MIVPSLSIVVVNLRMECFLNLKLIVQEILSEFGFLRSCVLFNVCKHFGLFRYISVHILSRNSAFM